ncbi:MAG: acetylxylan esterase [Candidatus Hydrogenedentes bacterium]|nr:acetylxylan esterase [Candidatus Hydrogenedentota bacterium]
MPFSHRSLQSILALALAGVLAPGAAPSEGQRTMRYKAGSANAAHAWQQDVRGQLAELLHLTDLAKSRATIPLEAETTGREDRDGFILETVRLRSTKGRSITCALAKPSPTPSGALPAVVCIHGHQGTQMTPFNPKEDIYKEFGAALAKRGFVVISTNVGQHEVYETGRTLMGERLWDLMRCVDYLQSLTEVDPKRIGCAGLSLGGEMAMWLGAMDERIAATVSAGFLTYMDQMEQNHCICWKFDGLRERVDYPDIYCLIAPRALQCQNGLKEPETQFTVPLARKAMEEVKPIYRDLGAAGNVELLVHEGAHEIALEPLIAFLDRHMKRPTAPQKDPAGR